MAERFQAQITPEKVEIEKTESTRNALKRRGLFRYPKF
jgi:hypothetical protein